MKILLIWNMHGLIMFRHNFILFGSISRKLLLLMNKYEILDRIGQGQYGVVLKGRNKETGQLVAIKKFKQDDSDEENKRVILREVKILKTLHHQNIIQLKQAFRKKGKIYLVCQYVDKNLLQILQEGPINSAFVKQYMYQLIKGIAYMHSINVIHRDIKPENVLISKQSAVKICDLGFARTIPNSHVLTDYVATRWYRAPELLIGRDDYDKSIDIWSVGCVMAQTFDGQPLFPGQNDLDQLYLIQKCLGPLISQHQEHFLKNPKFIGMKFPEIHSLESLQRRYFGKVDKQGIDLLKKMLKMDPSMRITAQEALLHPYFQRSCSLSQLQIKKTRVDQIDDKRYEQTTDFQANHSNNLIGAAKAIQANNFVEQKGNKEIGTNKVTGLLRLKKAQHDNLTNIRHNNMNRQDETPANKGKSLGKKINMVKDKNGAANNNRPRIIKSRVQAQRKDYADQIDQYYQQKWEEEDQEDILMDRRRDRSGIHGRQPKQLLQSPKKDEARRPKGLVKAQRKDNFNIVFNSNTYNLNLLQPSN